MERKSFPFELDEKGLDPEARTFKGYAAVTGILDDGGDIIDRGAFKKTLEESGHRVKVFYIHDFSKPIGRPVEYDDGTIGLREVSRSQLPKALRDKWPQATGGLFVHCYISPTSVGDEALTLMRDRVLDELSIGYKSVKEKMEDDGPDGQTARHLKELALLDVSPVPLAMNPAAVVTDVKMAELAQRIAEETGLTVEQAYEEFMSFLAEWNELPVWDEDKPYPNEHACRLKDPGQYDTCRRVKRKTDGKTYYVIYCKKTGGKMEEQAYRYPKDAWTADEARAHCKKHEGRFEAASEGSSAEECGCNEEAERQLIAAQMQRAEIQRRMIEAHLNN